LWKGALQIAPLRYLITSKVISNLTARLSQIVHVVHGDKGPSYLFVTDYTVHEYGPRLKTEELTTWAQGLEGRIFKIWLRDAQAEMGRRVDIGDFYRIKKVRMKKGSGENTFVGLIGGSERLIHKLNVKGTENEDLRALLM
jgi:hypothetical protein